MTKENNILKILHCANSKKIRWRLQTNLLLLPISIKGHKMLVEDSREIKFIIHYSLLYK